MISMTIYSLFTAGNFNSEQRTDEQKHSVDDDAIQVSTLFSSNEIISIYKT